MSDRLRRWIVLHPVVALSKNSETRLNSLVQHKKACRNMLLSFDGKAIVAAVAIFSSQMAWSQLNARVAPELIGDGIVSWNQVSPSLNSILLIRNHSNVCAIKFIESSKANDSNPPSLTNSGAPTVSAKYEWHFQRAGAENFVSADMTKGISYVSRSALLGIGRLAFRAGNSNIACGPFRQSWNYPRWVSFVDYDSRLKEDNIIEMALTAWVDVGKVRLDDPRLVWYRSDEARVRIDVRRDSLPN